MARPKRTIHEEEITLDSIRLQAEGNFEFFIRLIDPKQMLGGVHQELCQWMTRRSAKNHQLILMPRDHGKSRIAGFYALWELTRNPCARILYISSTSNLAEKQLGFIKDRMQTSLYRKYWPEMTHPEPGKRKKWTSTEIEVDHPLRVAEGVRDPSIMTAGLTTSITGLHFDIAILDDVVVMENAYTEEGRNKVKSQYSLLSSIESADAREIAVGTRYHPKDLYADMLEMAYDIYDKKGVVIERTEVYEVFERQVEDTGDGSGQFLWPRQQRTDGKWFGFDQNILATKRAKYLDRTQFRAQYYNDPNDTSSAGINRGLFQYYEPTFVKQVQGHWYYKGARLNLIASADFAYTLSKRADYTAMAVIGIDSDRNYYVLDIDRFKTNSIKEMYEHLLALHHKWDFRKLIAEANSAAEPIIEELKYAYLRPNGINVTIDMVKPNRHEGSKEERVKAILEPRYQNKAVWHYRAGNCQVLEDELVLQYPPHDDVRDAVANAFVHAVAPSGSMASNNINVVSIQTHPKFGGVC